MTLRIALSFTGSTGKVARHGRDAFTILECSVHNRVKNWGLSKTSERHASDASKIFRRCAGPGRHLDSDKRGAEEGRRFADVYIQSNIAFPLGLGDTALKSGEQRAIGSFRYHGYFRRR